MRRVLMAGGLVMALWPCAGVLAADVGGWFADQQKAAAQAAANGNADSCPQVLKRVAAQPSGPDAYHAALCYLQADPPDSVAAKAWLARSAELKYLPADRLLRRLLAAEAGPHAGAPHCHELGHGQQICHGGAPVAATVPK